MKPSITLALLITLLAAGESLAADRLVLRDLTIISDRKVVAMTLEGVQLDNGKVLGWDTIETGRLDGGRQALFEKYLKNVGVHLFRIRQRMENGDYRSLSPSAEAIAKYYRGKEGPTAYMVMQALMWGRMAEGQRAAAVAPYLYCFEYHRQAQGDAAGPPGDRRLKFDPSTGMCDELPPIWFDAEAAKEALPAVATAISQLKQPRPDAARIYYASLATAAGDKDAAQRALAGVGENVPRLSQLKLILEAQSEVLSGSSGAKIEQLAQAMPTMVEANQPLARYWLGMASLDSEDKKTRREGVLDLLHLPAVHGDDLPELAAAGLYQSLGALEDLGDLRGSIALRSELLSKYGQTWHAAQVAAADEENSK